MAIFRFDESFHDFARRHGFNSKLMKMKEDADDRGESRKNISFPYEGDVYEYDPAMKKLYELWKSRGEEHWRNLNGEKTNLS